MFLLLVSTGVAALSANLTAARGGQLRIEVVDAESGQPVAVRMHLKNAQGKPVRPPQVPFWKDHFALDGQITLKLPNGRYTFEIERGPEYRDYTGQFEIQSGANDQEQIEMHRIADMKAQGWWSGELHIHRPLDEIPLLMRAEDLHVAPVITWWRGRSRWKTPESEFAGVRVVDENRYYDDRAGEDERDGGALLYFGLNEPLDLAQAEPEYPSSARYLLEARQQEGVHIDVEKPFWWDVPMWLASRRVDSIGLANNHLWRTGGLHNEAWGKPRDKARFPDPHGNGRWSQAIYYQILNAGLCIPPSAGSASGVLDNPVGYNRVYVHCGSQFSYDRWWNGLRAGRVFVTNGPLLTTNVEGQVPGHVFEGTDGSPREFQIGLTLSTREKIEYLEVVKNGRTEHSVRLDQFAASGGRLPPVRFDDSGWFLVKAVTSNTKTYRFASTGPYYVVFDGRRRVSRSAAQFFLDWVHQRIDELEISDPQKQQAVMRYHKAARKFWQQRVEMANAE